FAAAVDEALPAPAQGSVPIDRAHQLDIAAALGHAHGERRAVFLAAQLREVQHRHVQLVAEQADQLVESLCSDGDAGHGGDHESSPAKNSTVVSWSPTPRMAQLRSVTPMSRKRWICFRSAASSPIMAMSAGPAAPSRSSMPR